MVENPSHSVYDLKAHMVWITKYRKLAPYGDSAVRWRGLTREICKSVDVEILKGHVSKDHVHLFYSIPPHLSVSKLVGRIKENSHESCYQKIGGYRNNFGVGICGLAVILQEVIMQYIATQDLQERAQD